MRGEAAVHRQGDGAHEARARAAQPQHRGGDLLRPAEAPRMMTVLLSSRDQPAWLVEAEGGGLRLASLNPRPVEPGRGEDDDPDARAIASRRQRRPKCVETRCRRALKQAR